MGHKCTPYFFLGISKCSHISIMKIAFNIFYQDEYLLLYQKITVTSSIFLFKPSKIEIYFMFSDLITVKKLAWNVIKSFRYLQLHTYLIFIPFIKKSLLKNQTTCWSQTAFHAKTNQFLKFAILSSLQEHFSNFFAFNLCIVLWTPDDQSL